MSRTATLAGALAALLLTADAPAAQGVEVLWYGQSAMKIATPGGKTILIDPFIANNPVTPEELKDLAAVGPVDLILVTHGHGDHVGDTAKLAEMTGAKVAMNADLGQAFNLLGIVPQEQLIRFNKSGPIQPLGEGITITMVHAEHSSELVHDGAVHPGGEPAGYILELEDGTVLYHAGDTGVFGDMAWIGSYYQPDVAFVPIGGHFTMDPAHAAYAVRELIKPETVVPIHYGTFPLLKGTPEEFEAELGAWGGTLAVMQPGETRDF